MALPPALREILERGVSGYLDARAPDAPAPTRPEQTAPAPTTAGVEPSLLSRINTGIGNIDADTLKTGALVLAGAVLLYVLVKRAA